MKPETFDIAADREDILQIRLDLRSIGFDYRRYIWIFLALFVGVFALTYLYLSSRPKLFTATAIVALDARNVALTPENLALVQLRQDDTPELLQVNTELVLLQQVSLAERVVESLKLDQHPAFAPPPVDPKTAKKTVTSAQSLQPAQTPDEKAALRRRAIAGALLYGLKIKRQETTRIVYLNYSSPSPELAADIANEWSLQYIAQKIDQNQAELQSAGSGMAARLDKLRGEVLAREEALANYKVANNLMTVGTSTLTESEISALNRQVASNKLDLAEQEAKLNTARQQLQNTGVSAEMAGPVGSRVLTTLRLKRAQITRQIADLQTTYGPRHPQVIAAQDQLSDIDQQIRIEGDRLLSSLEAEVDVDRRRLSQTQSSLGAATGQLVSANSASAGLSQLENDATAAQEVFEHYLNLYKQSLTANPAQNIHARLISLARTPSAPSSPNLVMAFIIALGLGTIAGVGGVFTRQIFETGIIAPGDIGYKLGLPHLATLVKVKSPSKNAPLSLPDYVIQNPGSAFAEGLRSLRTALLYTANDHGGIIAITSPLPSEGKSTTSVCLARVMALSGQSVIVVECDLRRPGLSRALGRRAENGLIEVLQGDANLEDVILNDDTGVDYLLAPRKDRDVTGVFEAPIMDRFITYLRHKYDIVILDTPPVLAIAETQILTKFADQTIMLVRWAKTPMRAVKAALSSLRQTGGPVIGIVLSQMDERLFKKSSMY
ncbi:AAA family ATPase [Asticcacaulis sp. ZE23SCel15]|uniref:GumC family protein n=1 Tax=Asticcacaulis sp. ZE23SCel15 TaxID=3059027 RepID=UPI00265E3B0A|nr:AAA family ATPase [Asticcacaulis sp. ZE23SCel15]WKL58595.1 AAA family ATPase [Asticcacaulis sp. ZE23SCel15]